MIGKFRFFSEQLLIGASLMALAAGLVYLESFWEWDQVIYDLTVKGWSRPAPDDVVIIAIDQPSLNALGRWPWPRRVHADLLDVLAAMRTGPVAMDIIFSEPDRSDPQSDARLVEAVRRHGNVVLPVVFDQAGHLRQGGSFVELLPFPPLDEIATLGHVDMDIDRDGIARSLYLQAGVDGAYWPALALALLRQHDPDALPALPGIDYRPHAAPLGTTLVRDHAIGLYFTGPPGHFRHYSYIDVLRGRVDAARLRGKTLLIGFTAVGQDMLPTPVSATYNPMPGVEIHANALLTLQRQLWLLPLGKPAAMLLSALLVLLALLLYPRLSPRLAPLATALSVTLALALSMTLLRYAQLWFAPLSAALVSVLSYMVWSWRRLQSTLGYLNQELARLNREPSLLPRPDIPDLAPVMEFLRHALPITGCVLHQPNGQLAQRWGESPGYPRRPRGGGILKHRRSWWVALPGRGGHWLLGVLWAPSAELTAEQATLVDDLIRPFQLTRLGEPVTPIEIMQERIEQVQQASERLRSMRAFINESLAQMADGVLVTDSLGQVWLHNPKAALFLHDDENASLAQQMLSTLFANLEFIGRETWQQALSDVLVYRQFKQLPARSRYGHDLLVQMAPFSDGQQVWRGLIVNFADIGPLRASERRRAEMLSFLSHDLRSPLASVMALTQLAHYKPEQLASGEITEQIAERTQAILALVDDFLQLARAESSDEIELGEVDIVPLAEQALEQVRPLAGARGTELVDAFHCEAAWLLGNGALLQRMFINLLTNALKYSPDNARIVLGLGEENGELRCSVADNGYGIPPEYLPVLFDRFQRIERAEHRREQGSGLGLAFVKSVVDRHHGRIEVVSELNRGTDFVMHFPLLDMEPAPGAPAPGAPASGEPA